MKYASLLECGAYHNRKTNEVYETVHGKECHPLKDRSCQQFSGALASLLVKGELMPTLPWYASYMLVCVTILACNVSSS